MVLLVLKEHLMWSRPDGHGGTINYYYYDQVTWVVAVLAAVWIAWLLIRRHRRLRALRRRPRGVNYRALKRVVRIKDELTADYLRAGFSANIHAIGIGRLLFGGDYCIQVFVSDATQELWPGAGATTLPASFRGVPLVLVQMPVAGFLYANGIRDQQATIVGGISGANANLTGQSGTIGYFCARTSKLPLPRRKDVYLLSNSHVFVDLQNPTVNDTDLIMQPSPGEKTGTRPIGKLTTFSPLKFDGDISEPNTIDAAIAKLWESQARQFLIPRIGAVKGYVPARDVEIGEKARKCGRSTGYTVGRVFSICLDIWIRYDRTGRSAFFKNQFLIEPASPRYDRFVSKGDSGSVVVDEGQQAIGLIFAGASGDRQPGPGVEDNRTANPETPTIDGYGVANPISEVLERLRIELLV